MNEHHYQRIDKGVKRGGRQRVVKRSEVEREARQAHDPETGRWLTAYSPETRAQAIQEAIEALSTGGLVEQIAERHQIPRSTLYSWLLHDSTTQDARTRFFHYQIGRCLHEMEGAANPLDLARWRDMRRAWAETAAVRDPKNYGPKQEITHVQADLGDRLRRAKERVINQEVTVIPELPKAEGT